MVIPYQCMHVGHQSMFLPLPPQICPPDNEGVMRWSYSRGHIGRLFDSLTDLEQASGAQEVQQLWLNCCLLVDETGETDDGIQEELANGLAHQSFAQLSLLSLCTNSLKVR